MKAFQKVTFTVHFRDGLPSRFFCFSLSTEHRIVTATDIDNPKFEVVLLPTVRASSFLHDFLDRYLFAIVFHQLRHRHVGCVTALAFK